jgi:hypothetical protein
MECLVYSLCQPRQGRLRQNTYSEQPREVLPDYHRQSILLRRPMQRHEVIPIIKNLRTWTAQCWEGLSSTVNIVKDVVEGLEGTLRRPAHRQKRRLEDDGLSLRFGQTILLHEILRNTTYCTLSTYL